MAEDEQSTAALVTAMQMSGFSVHGDDGSLAYESVKPGQGIMIDAWEVAALAKLFGDGMHTRMTDLSNSLATTFRPLKGAPVASLFLDGLRSAAKGDQQAMRFWADFIAELGRQSDQPYDLLAPDVDAAKINLDAIQVSLILRRLTADLKLQEDSKNKNKKTQLAPDRERNAQTRPASYDFESEARAHIRDAVWHPGNRARLVFVQDGGKLPCTLSDLEGQILDANAAAAAKGFDKMLEYMAEHGMEGAEKFGAATSVANAMLAIIKLIAAYACMETDITMGGDPPLVRTQSIYQPGEKRTLTATVRENIGKWQALNCTRIALNGMNLDISLPNDGPLAGVKTQWVLTSGSMETSRGEVTYPIVELVFPDGTPTIQNATGPITDASAPKTDADGHTTIDIEGVKQREKLSSPMPLMKQAAVRFTVAAKPANMSQDMIDAVATGISGPLGMGVGAPVEMLLRSNIYFSKELKIPVKDWNSCDGGWGGTISYSSTYSYNHDDPVNRMTDTKTATMHDEVQLHGNKDVGKGWTGSSNGNFTASYALNYRGTKTWPAASRPGMSFGGATETTEENASAAGGGETSVEISPKGDNKYDITTRSGVIQGVDLWHTTCAGDCRGKSLPDKNNPLTYSLDLSHITAQEDPDHPGVLHGSATLPSPMLGETLTANWNLTQCQDRK